METSNSATPPSPFSTTIPSELASSAWSIYDLKGVSTFLLDRGNRMSYGLANAIKEKGSLLLVGTTLGFTLVFFNEQQQEDSMDDYFIFVGSLGSETSFDDSVNCLDLVFSDGMKCHVAVGFKSGSIEVWEVQITPQSVVAEKPKFFNRFICSIPSGKSASSIIQVFFVGLHWNRLLSSNALGQVKVYDINQLLGIFSVDTHRILDLSQRPVNEVLKPGVTHGSKISRNDSVGSIPSFAKYKFSSLSNFLRPNSEIILPATDSPNETPFSHIEEISSGAPILEEESGENMLPRHKNVIVSTLERSSAKTQQEDMIDKFSLILIMTERKFLMASLKPSILPRFTHKEISYCNGSKSALVGLKPEMSLACLKLKREIVAAYSCEGVLHLLMLPFDFIRSGYRASFDGKMTASGGKKDQERWIQLNHGCRLLTKSFKEESGLEIGNLQILDKIKGEILGIVATQGGSNALSFYCYHASNDQFLFKVALSADYSILKASYFEGEENPFYYGSLNSITFDCNRKASRKYVLLGYEGVKVAKIKSALQMLQDLCEVHILVALDFGIHLCSDVATLKSPWLRNFYPISRDRDNRERRNLEEILLGLFFDYLSSHLFLSSLDDQVVDGLLPSNISSCLIPKSAYFGGSSSLSSSSLLVKQLAAMISVQFYLQFPKSPSLTLEDLYERFCDRKIGSEFLDQLEQPIISGIMSKSPPPPLIVKRLMERLVNCERFDQLEQCILQLDPTRLDLDYSVNISLQNHLCLSFLYLYQFGMFDIVTPTLYLCQHIFYYKYYDVLENIKVSRDKCAEIGRMVYVLGRFILTERAFPIGDAIRVSHDLLSSHRQAFIKVIFSEKVLLVDHFAISQLSSHLRGIVDEPRKFYYLNDASEDGQNTFPYLRLLLNFDSELFWAMLHSTTLLSSESYLDFPIFPLNPKENGENVMFCREFLIKTLIDQVVLKGNGESGSDSKQFRLPLYWYLCCTLRDFPNSVRLDLEFLKSALFDVLESNSDRQFSRSKLESICDELISQLQSSLTPEEDLRILNLLEEKCFWKLLEKRSISLGNYDYAIDSFILDDGDVARQRSVFDLIAFILREESPARIKAKIWKESKRLVQLDCASSVFLITTFYPLLLESFVESLEEGVPEERLIQFLFLDALFKGHGLGAFPSEHTVAASSLDLPMSIQCKYLNLSLIFNPAGVSEIIDKMEQSSDETLSLFESDPLLRQIAKKIFSLSDPRLMKVKVRLAAQQQEEGENGQEAPLKDLIRGQIAQVKGVNQLQHFDSVKFASDLSWSISQLSSKKDRMELALETLSSFMFNSGSRSIISITDFVQALDAGDLNLKEIFSSESPTSVLLRSSSFHFNSKFKGDYERLNFAMHSLEKELFLLFKEKLDNLKGGRLNSILKCCLCEGPLFFKNITDLKEESPVIATFDTCFHAFHHNCVTRIDNSTSATTTTTTNLKASIMSCPICSGKQLIFSDGGKGEANAAEENQNASSMELVLNVMDKIELMHYEKLSTIKGIILKSKRC